MGHLLGLRHSFNTSDFLILFLGFHSNYLTSRLEIMFDRVVYDTVIGYINIMILRESIVLIIGVASLMLFYLLKHKYYRK